MNERGRNESDISRYTDVEDSPEGYKTVYRWGDFLEIAGGHVYNAMDTIDLVSTGGEYEGFNPRYAYTCEFVGCSTLVDGIALFRPVSRDGEDLNQIAFIEAAPVELQDDYPTPVHVFTYDGRDSEPVHRTDVHLDGEAMTLDPVKGVPVHNAAQAHGGDRRPADLAKAASAAANRTAGSHADEAGGIKH